MAYSFSAEQFDKEFRANSLGNWEVPKWFPDKPCARRGHTKVISNDQGHLLPGVRKSCSNPWGNYVGTWKLPKRITREIAQELTQPDPHKLEDRRRKYINEKFPDDSKPLAIDNTRSHEVCEIEETTKTDNLPKLENDEAKPYVPGDLTSPRHRHPSYEMLKNTLVDKVTLPNINQTSSERYSYSGEERLPPEVAIAIDNFQTAKKFHQENLEHQPLPETVTDPFYRKLQMQRHPHPGIALTVEPVVTGVGYKPYGGYSPTQCTKLKVYRPKTCTPCSKQDRHQKNIRPNTTDKKRTVHTIIQKDITPIELALCWDVIPENPDDEPKRTVHIDGSNGSAAPAVFTKVYSPKPIEESKDETTRCHTQSFFEKVQNPQRDPGDNDIYEMNPLPRAKSAWCGKKDKDLCNHIKQMKISDNGHDEPAKIPDNMSHCSSKTDSKKCSKHSHSSYQSHKSADAANHRILERQNHYSQSSPNLSVYGDKVKKFTKSYEKLTPEYKQLFCRPCPACEVKNWNKEKSRPKSEYKMAFKAGKPNSNHSDSNSNGSHKQYLCIPKPRDPFVRKNYRITTLAPPFCLKPEKRDCDYPEHWRLASVYQHSYKPMQTRKRPLLASVYN